jgi:iron complex outermembrane receptor protein
LLPAAKTYYQRIRRLDGTVEITMGHIPGSRITQLTLLVVSALVIMAQQAAQAEDTPGDTNKLERVEVTGSSIKRTIESETALPVQIITHEDIVRSGVQNSEDLLKTVSATSSFSALQSAQGSGNTTSGASTISLRGLGDNRTLVLINGKRSSVYGGVPGGGGSSAVDVGSIPISAIERVEILKDGASAVYGSDAIAGVVNFILRSNYNHGEISATYGDTRDGGAKQKKISGSVGFGDLLTDKFNIMFSGNYQKEDALYGRDRPFAATSYHPSTDKAVSNNTLSSNTFPANVVGPTNGDRTNPGAPANCAPSIHLPGEALCRFDTAPYVALIPQTERFNGLVSGHLQINDDTQAYTDLAFARVKTTYTIQPSPLSDLFSVPPANPYNAYVKGIETQYPGTVAAYGGSFQGLSAVLLVPGSRYYNQALATMSAADQAAITSNNSAIDLRFRSFPAGLRSIQDVADNSRIVVGLKGLAFGWDYDASAVYNQSKVTESTLSGYVQQSIFLPLMDNGTINPFGPSDAAGQAAASAATFNGEAFHSKSSLSEIGAKVSRDIAEVPGGGPVSVALGASLRQDKFEFGASSQIASGDVSGYGGNFIQVSKSRHVSAAFAEISAEVTKTIELDGAVRYEDYQGTGSTVTPKISARWQPNSAFLVRSSWGKGFRAPSLTDLYSPNVQGVSSTLSDPASCDASGNVLPGKNPKNCQTQFQTQNGGNDKLQPEKSENFSLGVVWEPAKNVLANLDFYHINVSKTIGIISATTVLSSTAYESQYANLITRDGAGYITSVSQQNQNLFNIRTSGIDFGTHWLFLKNDTGSWTAGVDGTYITKFAIQQSDGTYQDAVNSAYVANDLNGYNGVVSRVRYAASLKWDTAAWNSTLIWNHQDSYIDATSTASSTQFHTVSAYETVDLSAQYTGFKGWILALGARNLFNTFPPYSNVGGQAQFQSGYDPTYGDPRGRFTYGSITYKFK